MDKRKGARGRKGWHREREEKGSKTKEQAREKGHSMGDAIHVGDHTSAEIALKGEQTRVTGR